MHGIHTINLKREKLILMDKYICQNVVRQTYKFMHFFVVCVSHAQGCCHAKGLATQDWQFCQYGRSFGYEIAKNHFPEALQM